MKKILKILIFIFIYQFINFSYIYPEEKGNDQFQNLKQELIQENNKLNDKIEKLHKESDLLWLMITAFLVFIMQAGFAYVEAGFTRAKNAVNILMKNILDFSIGAVAYWFVGFSMMFGKHYFPYIGVGEIHIASSLLNNQEGNPIAWNYGFFMFQTVFAGTAATIVSGTMAERTKFYIYVIFSAISTAIIYPIFGSLAWSNLFDEHNIGYLANQGFIDFAGSTVVHSIGGWMGLAGTIVLGPRIGKYTKEGIQPILGHNLSMAVMGMFLLWFGWFGFNPGSTGTIRDGNFAIIAVTTNLAASTGGLGALVTSWIIFRHFDASMTINGVIAGLVAITAGCNNVDGTGAILIGFIAGILVVLFVIFFDYFHIDDPVGAISVHGIAGAWGTIAVGLFANPKFGTNVAGLFYGGGIELLKIQGIGVLVAFFWAFPVSLLLFLILKYTIGLRVSVEEEIEGLDLIEHGNEAYPIDVG